MKKTLLSAMMLCLSMMATAQPAGGFGGFQMPQVNLETSQQWKDVNYVGDDQAFHTCDIYLPKQEKAAYPVVIHIYGSAWFSNSSKGAADLGTIVKALLDNGFAVVCPNHRSSMDAKWPAQINDIRAVPSSASCAERPRSISSTPRSLPPAASPAAATSPRRLPPPVA